MPGRQTRRRPSLRSRRARTLTAPHPSRPRSRSGSNPRRARRRSTGRRDARGRRSRLRRWSPPRVAAPAPPPEVPADRPPEPVAEDVAPQESGSEAAAALPTPREPAAPSRRAAGTRAPGRDRRAELRIPREERKLLDLLDRKANSAGPSVPVEKLSLDTGRASLDPAAVKRILAESNGAFSACATRALKGGAPLRADRRATLLLTVQSSGAVASASIAEAEVEGSPLGHCLRAAALRLAFPSFAGDTLDVSVPLALSSVR
jgi:hypothetical protein